MTSVRGISIVSILSAASIVAGCAHRTANVDMEVLEAWSPSTKLVRPDPPPSRFLKWDDAKSQGIPREKMVWIYYWDEEPCEKLSSHPIADVTKFIDENVDQRGAVWVVVQPWDLTDDSMVGFHNLLDVCVASRAKGVIIAKTLHGNAGAFPLRVPKPGRPRFTPLMREHMEKRKNQAAQPGATDNPGDAQ